MCGIEASKSLKTGFCKNHGMKETGKKIVFANKKLESDYKQLSSSENSEDKKLYVVLRQARKKLRNQYQSGREIPKHKIPAIYRRMFQIENLWELKVLRHNTVLYSIVGDEIWIVDMV